MARKKTRLSKAERERRREKRADQEEENLVQDTVARLGCTVKTAEDMTAQSERRLEDIDLDVTFTGLALDVWRDRPAGRDLVPLLEQAIAEQRRHAEVIRTLRERFHALSDREHEHLPDDAIDPEWVRRGLFTPPEDRPQIDVDRQIPTESTRR